MFVVGKTIDIATKTIHELTVESGSTQDAQDTVFVMGGGDWKDWVTFLKENNVLNLGFKTIAYTYIGGSTTEAKRAHFVVGEFKGVVLGVRERANASVQCISKRLPHVSYTCS